MAGCVNTLNQVLTMPCWSELIRGLSPHPQCHMPAKGQGQGQGRHPSSEEEMDLDLDLVAPWQGPPLAFSHLCDTRTEYYDWPTD